MKFPRRRFLQLTAAACVLPANLRHAGAQAYPSRPVRLIVGVPAGGAADGLARLIGQWLSERLGQQFVVENRPGAGTNLAAETVVRSPPDGYTLLLVGPTAAINATLYEHLNFNFIHDIAPISGIIREPLIMEVSPSMAASTVSEFIAYAKANPGSINMASAGHGTANHMAGELFKIMAGVDLTHIPYRGGAPALADLLSGHVQVYFDNLSGSIELVRAGRLRALGVTTTKRSDVLPDVPSLGEFVAGYEASSWFGIGAAKNTPAEIIDRLNAEINAALLDPTIRGLLTERGGTVIPGKPAEFKQLISSETEKSGKVVREIGIRAE